MDGIEATAILRKTGYTGTIVALTANALVGNEEKFLKNGFDGFITKPIDIKKLDDIVNRFVRDRHKEDKEDKENKETEEDKETGSLS
jgi:CheY-like chemotaxis protein